MRRTTKRKIFWMTVLAVALAGGAWAVVGGVERPDQPLEVSPALANLGTVPRLGGVVSTKVEVRNPGTRSLTIKSITTS